MANYSVMRHTFTKPEIATIQEALDQYTKNPKVEAAQKHHAAAIHSYLNAVHRLSISYIVTEQK